MRVFLTGATGYVATAVAAELKGAGHTVLGLARNVEGAAGLEARGVEPHRGELADHASLIAGAAACDGVIHCAFIHDFSRFVENAEIERVAVEAMLASLEGSNKPFIATSGVAMLAEGRPATEQDRPGAFGRGDGAAGQRGGDQRGHCQRGADLTIPNRISAHPPLPSWLKLLVSIPL